MKVSFWITVKENGSVKSTKNKPSVQTDEVAININLALPDALFRKPKLVAEIKIPDEVARPEIVNSIVADNVTEAIEQATGLNFKISVEQPEIEE